jgi:hypothetical protein
MGQTSIFRGDSDTWTLSVPLTIWTAGGSFFFALKSKSDINTADATDSLAVLKKTYTDSSITSTTDTDKVNTLTLTHTDTKDISPSKYIAEFQWVNADASVVKTFTQFKYQIKGDVNQRVA